MGQVYETTADPSHGFIDLMASLFVLAILLAVMTMGAALPPDAPPSPSAPPAPEHAPSPTSPTGPGPGGDCQSATKSSSANVICEPGGKTIVLSTDSLRFASGSAALPPTGVAIVEREVGSRIAGVCGKHEAGELKQIAIEGHSDRQGEINPHFGTLGNIELSQKRAFAVLAATYAYLDKIKDRTVVDCFRKYAYATGRGAAEPVDTSNVADDAPKNRRVEIHIRYKDEMKGR